jgi:hypothetical protein
MYCAQLSKIKLHTSNIKYIGLEEATKNLGSLWKYTAVYCKCEASDTVRIRIRILRLRIQQDEALLSRAEDYSLNAT